jgi:hypothetical protein
MSKRAPFSQILVEYYIIKYSPVFFSIYIPHPTIEHVITVAGILLDLETLPWSASLILPKQL